MTMYAMNRDPERLVIWIDDDLFLTREGDAGILFAAGAGHVGNKPELLRVLTSMTTYSLLLSDEGGDSASEKIGNYPIETQHRTSEDVSRPTWMTAAAWRMVGEARHVMWLIDIWDSKVQDDAAGSTRTFRELLPALLRLAVPRENAARQHRVAIISQLNAADIERHCGKVDVTNIMEHCLREDAAHRVIPVILNAMRGAK
jgi:hypothetical protein